MKQRLRKMQWNSHGLEASMSPNRTFRYVCFFGSLGLPLAISRNGTSSESTHLEHIHLHIKQSNCTAWCDILEYHRSTIMEQRSGIFLG
uniref:Uncharacterized protein n=1 Tax=Anguilla anguilla TaxID=7936 RepID=A0A0E9XGJ4_ANGAN